MFWLFKNKQLQFEKKSLKDLFSFLSKDYITDLCNKNPNSISARKIWFFYEILEKVEIDFVWTKAAYLNILDDGIFFVSNWIKNKKFKLIDNLLWNINWFNPYIQKTEEIKEKINFLKEQVTENDKEVYKNSSHWENSIEAFSFLKTLK